MKAVIWTAYGPPEVLQLQDVPRPVPKGEEVLIKVHATTVTAGDCEMRRFDIPPLFWLPLRLYLGIRRPRYKRIGQEFAGEIVEVGNNVTNYKTGDQIFGVPKISVGSYSEYICLPAKGGFTFKPNNMTYKEATTIPMGGLNALYFLRKANIKPGEKVLIDGAGGSIGTYGLQIAKSAGAEVTVVDDALKLDMLRALGADHCVDYTKEKYTQSSIKYDVIFDVIGKTPLSKKVRSLSPKGRLILTYPNIASILKKLWFSIFSNKKIITGSASESPADFQELVNRIESGELKAAIDRTYPLKDIVEAHRYVENNLKQGNLVIELR